MKESNKTKKLKIVVLGNKSVGKSSIIRRFVLDDFISDIQATIGVDYMSKTVEIGGQKLRLQLWDTAGQQKFRSLVKGYLKKADACIFVYDAKNINSYLSLYEWISLFENTNNQNSFCMIIGNKIDLCDQTDLNEIQAAKQISKLNSKVGEFEEILCSAKTDQNVTKLFERVAMKAYESAQGKSLGYNSILSKLSPPSNSCCSN